MACRRIEDEDFSYFEFAKPMIRIGVGLPLFWANYV
jgi:hypothetical protein